MTPLKLPFKLPELNQKNLCRVILIAGCLLAWCALQIFRTRTVNGLRDLRAAGAFAPEGGYAQVSCYFTEGEDVPAERYREFSWRVENALTVNAVTSESDNPEARLFVDCFSAEGKVTLSRGTKTATASAIGTGGDFFYLHPVELLDGMCYQADALTQDQILIDETVAWQLFGGTDIAGQEVLIGDAPHIVRGVVKTAEGRMQEAAGASGAFVYLPFSSLSAYGVMHGAEDAISCYEIVMPNPVRGFAASLLREQLDFDETQMRVVDHSVRFGNLALWNVLRSYGTRSMAGAAMRYPYWENLARGAEDVLVIVMALQALCLALPVILLTVYIVRAYRNKKWTAQGVWEGLSDRVYELQAKRAGQHRKMTI